MSSNSPDSENTVFAHLQADLHALAADLRLEANIRKARENPGIGEAARRVRIARLSDVRAQVEAQLSQMGEQVNSLAAIVIRTPEGLSAVYMNPLFSFATPIRQAAGPGEEVKPAVQKETTAKDHMIDCAQQLDIETKDHLKVSIVNVSEGGTNVFIQVAHEPLKGWLKVVELVAEDGVMKELETGIEVYMKDGKAEINNCPTGILKVVVPGGRSASFCTDEFHGEQHSDERAL